MLQHLLGPNDDDWVVPVPGHQSWTAERLVAEQPHWSAQLQDAASAEEALEALAQRSAWPEPAPLIAGSLYLIGDLLGSGQVTAK